MSKVWTTVFSNSFLPRWTPRLEKDWQSSGYVGLGMGRAKVQSDPSLARSLLTNLFAHAIDPPKTRTKPKHPKSLNRSMFRRQPDICFPSLLLCLSNLAESQKTTKEKCSNIICFVVPKSLTLVESRSQWYQMNE